MKRIEMVLSFSLCAGVVSIGAENSSAQVRTTPAPVELRRSSFTSDSAIQAILAERINKDQQSVGIVVGLVEPEGRRVVSYGQMGAADPRPVDGTTLFEIGSISKVFNALLLARMVQQRELELDDPLAKFLPPTVYVPSRGDRVITLLDLATHTSALPPAPTNLSPRSITNPYAGYTTADLYQYLSGARLTRDIGTQFEYSNLGGALLGHALARRADTDYETLIRARVLAPLGLDNTRITLPSDFAARFATGHNPVLRPVPHWDFDVMAPAGAWRSTANDLLTFVAANLGLVHSPLDSAIVAMRQVRRPGAGQTAKMALGWFVVSLPGHEWFLHGGTTAGFQTFLAFDLERRIGVVVLSNAGTPAGIQDIGMHLLDNTLPLYHPPARKEHRPIAVPPEVLERCVGRYELRPGVVLTVTREVDKLFAQVTGQNRFELFAEAPNSFFAKVADIQFTFETDAEGRVIAAMQHQLGVEQRWKRIE